MQTQSSTAGIRDAVPGAIWRYSALFFASVIVVAATLIVFAVLVVPVFYGFFYGGLIVSLGVNPLLAFEASGAFIIYLSRRPPLAECAVTIGVAALIRLTYDQVFPGPSPYFGASLIGWGGFLGVASLFTLTVRAVRDSGAERKRDLFDLMAGAAWFYYWIILVIALLLTYLIPRTYDQFLYAFDGSLGFQPSFLLGRLLYDRTVEHLVATLYFAIGLPVALLYAAQRRRGYALGYKIFPLLIAASIGGYCLYFVVPATGPVYEFAGQFPFVIPPVSLHVGEVLALPQRALRNGMPSLHFGTALMLCWNCRIWRKSARTAVWAFMLATAFATLATGQHYLVDLVVACPLMLAFHAAALTAVPLGLRERWLPIVAGLGATFAWLAFLRYDVVLCLGRPALSWSLVLITIIGCWMLERRLWKTAINCAGAPS